MALRAVIGSKHPQSPFRMVCSITPRGVFFDRVITDNAMHKERLLVLHTTPAKARRLAQWILDNTGES